MSDLEWHGEKAYATCPVCHKLVHVNKPLGTLHFCLSACERAGRHLGIMTRRVGPFWSRRTETFCEKCHRIISTEK